MDLTRVRFRKRHPSYPWRSVPIVRADRGPSDDRYLLQFTTLPYRLEIEKHLQILPSAYGSEIDVAEIVMRFGSGPLALLKFQPNSGAVGGGYINCIPYEDLFELAAILAPYRQAPP